MSGPDEYAHGDALHRSAQQELASLALGEQLDPQLDSHVRDCAICRRDLETYRHLTELARANPRTNDVLDAPPPQVWDGITAELGIVPPAAAPPTPPPPARLPPSDLHAFRGRRVRVAVLAAAAAVVLVGSGVVGWAIGRDGSGGGQARASQAFLAAQPGTSGSAHGTAVVHSSSVGYTMQVSANGLPAPAGYYEVWLYNPSINQMVSVGTLGAGTRGTFTVPDGIDLRAYHVVDVSAQKYDGNNAHERSVLRGPLAP